MNIDRIVELSQKPVVYERSEAELWDDPHISQKMLEAHLDPHLDAASRSREAITAAVEWLGANVLPEKAGKILDLGCGPGLYASRLARRGYTVTGIDYSKRSIEYARKKAAAEGLEIEYVYQNYLDIAYEDEFEAVLLIYCDLGALTNEERDILLPKIYRALKPGGIFVFDVFTAQKRGKSELGKTWEAVEEGFWKAEPYLALTETFLYPEEDTYLDQTLVMGAEGDIEVYRVFEHFYNQETISDLLNRFGFKEHQYYADLQGSDFGKNSETLAVVTRK